MTQGYQERTLKIISDHHSQFADFARKSYDTDGRGVIQVGFPNVPAGETFLGVGMLKYVALEELQRIAPSGEDAAILVGMVKSYDPSRQAVVTAMIEGELPISIKMKLEPPVIVDEADGVH